MAKKSSKSTRRSRTLKQGAAKKKQIAKKTVAAIAEGSDEPVAKVEEARVEESNTTKNESPIETAVKSEAEKILQQPTDATRWSARNRMLTSAVVLGVVIVALITGAVLVRQQNASQKSEMVKSGQTSGRADQILQDGGNVCTNGSSQTDTTASSNPESVGMMLQANPANNIQTPQTLSNGSDANTLQGANCF